jgi:hypothetical protein
MSADEQNQASNKEKEQDTMPSLTTAADAQAQEKQASNVNRKRTRLHAVINEAWGYKWLDDDAFLSIINYVDPETAERNKKAGFFELELLNGGKIKWAPPNQNEPEKISCPPRKFNAEAAAAMVSLARLRGWKTVNVDGTVEQKEMLWLEVMRQNLLDKESFERKQKDGTIPKKSQDGKDIVYTPLTVANFVPLADSPVFQQWLKEEADYNARHAETGLTQDDGKAPEKKAENEVQKPEAETKKTEPEKKTDIESKFVDKTGEKKASPESRKKFPAKDGGFYAQKFNKVSSKSLNNLTYHKHRGGSKHTPH